MPRGTDVVLATVVVVEVVMECICTNYLESANPTSAINKALN